MGGTGCAGSPGTPGDCGPLPNVSHAEPPGDTKHQQSFGVDSTVRYSCVPGYTRLPFLSDTIQCLKNSQWSQLPEFCGRSCPSPPPVLFANISPQDQTQNFYAVNTTVRYICRPGFENTTDQLPTSTCLDNLSWSKVPELCQRKSCGIPANPEHGQVTTNNHLFGARARVVCDHGYRLKGVSPHIFCLLQGDEVAWSALPACQAISCPPPPAIPRGQHSGNSSEQFVFGSVTTYSCEPGLELVGQDTLRCTTDNGLNGTWSGAPPECRGKDHSPDTHSSFVLRSTVSTTRHGFTFFPSRGTVSPTAETNLTTPLEENPYWLAIVLILSCVVPVVVLGLVAAIVMRQKGKDKHSYNINLQKHEMKGRDAPMHLAVAAEKKQPKPWNSYFCHTRSCHVCPRCEEQLHGDLSPPGDPARRGCATCQDWLSSQTEKPRTYSIPSIGDRVSESPGGSSSPAKAVDVLRADGTGEAGPQWSEAEQPMDHKSDHICPICENWLRAHTGQGGSPAVTPEQQQDKGPWGPVCPLCTDQQLLTLVYSNTPSSPVCPLAGEGTLAHLVPLHSPSCHVCPVCAVPTHAHLCQPWHSAPDG